ncbi:Na+/H+ antiporter NhaC family protein [Microbacterium sp. NPDC091313]
MSQTRVQNPPVTPAGVVPPPGSEADGPRLTFFIGMAGALVAPTVFLVGVIVFFMVFGAFEISVLTASGLAGLFIAALFSRSYGRYWEWVARGVASPTSVTLLVLFLAIGLISALITQTDVASGFIWLAQAAGVGGGLFVFIAFVIVCVVSMATGASLGSMFTAFPIFYPAGVLLGADPVLLAGAIVSGALFGDNLAPISDSTIVSASTQRYRRRAGVADIGGVVRSRSRYAIPAALVSGVLFLLLGLLGSSSGGSGASTDVTGDPLRLVMVIPVGALLAVAFWKRDLFLAATVGIVSGIVIGLATGLMTPADILSASADGGVSGFLVSGIQGVLPMIGLGIIIFGMIGVLQGAGVFDAIVDFVTRSRMARTATGAELIIGLGSAVTTTVFAGVNSPAMLLFGPVADRVGAVARLHPYRRANVMDCFALGIGAVMPIGSIFLIIASQLTQGYGEEVPALSSTSIFIACLYPFALTAMIGISVLTGWGRRFEGVDGAPVRSVDDRETVGDPATA